MRKQFTHVVFATIIAALGGQVSAADLPVSRGVVQPVRAGCAQFGGWFVGGNVGWGYYNHTFSDRDGLAKNVDNGLPSSVKLTDDGFIGGVQTGYNWQRGCTVFGIEADWNWTGLKSSELHRDGDQSALNPITDTVTVSTDLRWFGTVRSRAGVVVDNVLLFATGGVAYANFRRSWSFFQDGPANTLTFAATDTKLGLVGGVGVEWQWAHNWSLKSEVLYMQFEKSQGVGLGNSARGIGNTGVSYRLESDDSVWLSRVGLNYRFGGPI